MSEKRFTALPMTASYKDNVTDEIFAPKYEKEYYAFLDRINQISEENEQLRERNQRQAKRLAELYELMAKKDWETLTEIIDDFCSCEEQLQREWGTYGDVE